MYRRGRLHDKPKASQTYLYLRKQLGCAIVSKTLFIGGRNADSQNKWFRRTWDLSLRIATPDPDGTRFRQRAWVKISVDVMLYVEPPMVQSEPRSILSNWLPANWKASLALKNSVLVTVERFWVPSLTSCGLHVASLSRMYLNSLKSIWAKSLLNDLIDINSTTRSIHINKDLLVHIPCTYDSRTFHQQHSYSITMPSPGIDLTQRHRQKSRVLCGVHITACSVLVGHLWHRENNIGTTSLCLAAPMHVVCE